MPNVQKNLIPTTKISGFEEEKDLHNSLEPVNGAKVEEKKHCCKPKIWFVIIINIK